MEDSSRSDIRRLLKTFGVQADEAILRYIVQNPGLPPLQLRITLTDLTDYGTDRPAKPLALVVDGEVRRD
jgi:hypothetical protein